MGYNVTGEDLESIISLWSRSDRRLVWPSPFVLPAWLKVWWQVFRPDGRLFLRSVRDNDKPVGIAPLYLNGDTAMFIGRDDVCDYLDFVTDPVEAEGFFRALLADLKGNGISRLDLGYVRPDSTVLTVFRPLAEKLGHEISVSRSDVTVEMDLPATFDGYLEALDGKQRHEVRRKLRRLAETGQVSFRRIEGGEDLAAALDVFLRMFVESRSDKAHFLTGQMATFFRTMTDAMAGIGTLKIGRLDLDERPVAAVLYFDYHETIYLYNSGYDPDYDYLSVGLVNKVLTIKDSIERGKKRFDFLKGGETYKYRLGGHEIPLYRCLIMIK